MWTRYLHIPFVQDGRDFAGCDCYGLLWLVYKQELGIELQSFGQAYETREELLIKHTLDEWRRITQPETFDAVVFTGSGQPSHIGLVVQPGQMLHTCHRRGGPAIERYTTFAWRPRIEGFYRCCLLELSTS